MTYDERQEIEVYLDIVSKNAQRLQRSIDMLKDKIDKCKCQINQKDENTNIGGKE